MKKIALIQLTLLFVLGTCAKDTDQAGHTWVFPPVEGADFTYNGYVTDTKLDLQSDIYTFHRIFAASDTSGDQIMHYYIANQKRVPYYTDENGTVWERQTEDISGRIIAYQLKSSHPLTIAYWKPLLKSGEGLKTEWDIKIDTTFQVLSRDGEKQELQYSHYAKAKYMGWKSVIVHQRRNNAYHCMQVDWPIVRTCIINRTTGDSLFISDGSARQVFEPNLGAIKYMTDFTLHEFGKSPVERKGTWELTSVNIHK